LVVYPRVHPSTRQSQLDLRSVPPPPAFLGFHHRLATGDLRPLEVVLGPGDVLYLPPYFWHRASVPANETSISLGVYSQSTAVAVYEVLKTHPLPWDASLAPSLRRGALREYVLGVAGLAPPGLDYSSAGEAAEFSCAVADRCSCPADGVHDAAARRLLAALLEERFANLARDVSSRGLPQLAAAAAEEWRREGASAARAPSGRLAGKLRAHAQQLRWKVEAMPARERLTASIWRMEISSLVEDITCAAVGPRYVEAAIRWITHGESLTSSFGET